MSYAKFRPEKLKNKDQNEVGGAYASTHPLPLKIDQGFVNL